MTVRRSHFILYVADQEPSRAFWAAVLLKTPSLHVPGMTEFTLGEGVVLGLMPEKGIARLLGGRIDPSLGRGGPRAELYLVVDDALAYHRRALAAGAHELDPLSPRDWGHRVSYVLDPDGHVVAFAEV